MTPQSPQHFQGKTIFDTFRENADVSSLIPNLKCSSSFVAHSIFNFYAVINTLNTSAWHLRTKCKLLKPTYIHCSDRSRISQRGRQFLRVANQCLTNFPKSYIKMKKFWSKWASLGFPGSATVLDMFGALF